jgi:hypothetical protein
MKKLMFTFALLNCFENISAMHRKYEPPTTYPDDLCTCQQNQLHCHATYNARGNMTVSNPVQYDQSSFPQPNGIETIHVYAQYMIIRNDIEGKDTFFIPLSEFKAKKSLKLEDGRTIHFTESSKENGIITYDMPRIEQSSSCTIS